MIAGKISEDEYAMQREVNIEEFEECDEKLSTLRCRYGK